ncbi:MAG TPA: hypothetical protein VKZ68_09425 [Ohtaekwangia sp.]|nr:hypothetical protein [Ohtaekwangia sp.]
METRNATAADYNRRSLFRWFITFAGIVTAFTCIYVLNTMNDETDARNVQASPIFSRSLKPAPSNLATGVSGAVVLLFDSVIK